jgi:3-oxoacyl-[acyl-carrier protein] reductase
MTLFAHTRSGVQKLKLLKEEIPSLAKDLKIVKADLRSEIELQGMIETIRASHGFPTQIVHLAAAKLELKRMKEFNWERLTADLEIQVKSITTILNQFLPDMVKSGKRCKVVFMLSSLTLAAPPKYMTQYTIGKYALMGLFRSLVVEYMNKPICFNAVSPSMVETQFLSNIPKMYVEMAAEANPSKRNASTSDVVPAICFLLSPGSDYINGSNIPITAGSII